MKMLTRNRITDQKEVLKLIENEYGSGFFDGVAYDTKALKTAVSSSPGFRATLSRPEAHAKPNEDEAQYADLDDNAVQHVAALELRFPEWMWINGDGEVLNPLRGIESDVLARDLRLGMAGYDEVRFLFGWARFSYGDDPLCPDKIEFCVVDDADLAHNIDSIMVIRRRCGQPPEWHHDASWSPSYLELQGSKPCVIKFDLQATNDKGVLFDFSCYQLGARMPALTRDNKFLWEEENLKYDNFENFVKGRKPYAHKLCARLLERYNDARSTNVPLDNLLTIDDHCVSINRRIFALRRHEGLNGLEAYNVCSDRLGDLYLVLGQADKPHYTVAQARNRIAQFEQLVELRNTYAKCFMMMKPKIEGICGHLSVDNVYFSEIKIPTRHSVQGEKVMETHQFSYTPQGIKAASDWLDIEQAAFNEGLESICDQFQLELADGILRPIKQQDS